VNDFAVFYHRKCESGNVVFCHGRPQKCFCFVFVILLGAGRQRQTDQKEG
jgi:hypothetical protein